MTGGLNLTGWVTGIGSMPEMPTSQAAGWIVDQWPDLPHLAELPSRGPWSDMIGRAGALLPGLALDLTAHGWRVVATPGADQRRIETLMRSDIDALEDAVAGERTRIKIQVAGPWTLAGALEGSTGRRLLQDQGACRDLAQSLAEGIAGQIEQIKRIGASDVVVQIDEPSITAIRTGSAGTLFSQPRIPDDEQIVLLWRSLRERVGPQTALVLHCCAPDLPWPLVQVFDAISLDGTLQHDEEGLGAWIDAGRAVWWGAFAVQNAPVPDLSTSVRRVRTLFNRLGFDRVSERLTLTPACGLVGTTLSGAEEIAKALHQLRDALREAEA